MEFEKRKSESVKPEYLVYKSNPLLMARDDLSLMQARFFTAYLCKVEPGNPETYVVRFSLDAFCKMLDVDATNIKRLKRDCKAVRQMGFDFAEYRRKHGEKLDPMLMKEVSLFEIFELGGNTEDGYFVEVTPTRQMEHLLENQKKYGYVEYEARNTLTLSTKRNMRMYEFFKRHQGKGVNVDVPTLKVYFGLSKDDYPDLRDFRRDVLEKGIKEINLKTDILVSYEPFKRGAKGKIMSYSFSVMNNSGNAVIDASFNEDESPNGFLPGQITIDELAADDDSGFEREEKERKERSRRQDLCDGFQAEIFDSLSYEELVELKNLAMPNIRYDELRRRTQGEYCDEGDYVDLRDNALVSYVREKILYVDAKRNVKERYTYIKNAVKNDWK